MYAATGPGVPGTTGTPAAMAVGTVNTPLLVRCDSMECWLKRTDGPRFGLVAQAVDNLRRGSNKRETRLLDLACELGILAEEAVTEIIQNICSVCQGLGTHVQGELG